MHRQDRKPEIHGHEMLKWNRGGIWCIVVFEHREAGEDDGEFDQRRTRDQDLGNVRRSGWDIVQSREPEFLKV